MPKSTALITFAQFAIVSLEGAQRFIKIEPTIQQHPSLRGFIPKKVQTKTPWLPYKIVLAPTAVPKYHWLIMVLMFWTVSLLNNLALEYRIDLALHIIFKSSSLLVNLIFGRMLGKRYTLKQVIAVFLVTFGVIYVTVLSSNSLQSSSSTSSRTTRSSPNIGVNSSNTESSPEANSNIDDYASEHMADWLFGITLMTISLIVSAILGLYQEHVYEKYGKHWRESLFYTHFFGIPFFILFTNKIMSQFALMTTIEHAWFWLLMNAGTQMLCIAGVHRLSSISTSLTVNFVLTMRKFVSLLLSILYFGKIFTIQHVFGTFMVFIGTLLYSVSSSAKSSNAATTETPLSPIRRSQRLLNKSF